MGGGRWEDHSLLFVPTLEELDSLITLIVISAKDVTKDALKNSKLSNQLISVVVSSGDRIVHSNVVRETSLSDTCKQLFSPSYMPPLYETLPSSP